MKKVLALVLCLSVSSMVSADLVQHWTLDGDATNSVVGGVDGAAAPTITYTPGVFGQAAVFNGTDTFIDLASELVPAGKTLTLSYWINPQSFDGSIGQEHYDSVISTYGWDGNSIHSVLRTVNAGETDGAVAVGMGIAGTSQWDTDGVLTLNQWNHFAWTFDSTGADLVCKYYINGQLDVTKTAAGLGGTAISYGVATIGAWDAWGTHARFLKAQVDDMRIYNTALSQSEIAAMVPEPMTMSLLALGGLALAHRRR